MDPVPRAWSGYKLHENSSCTLSSERVNYAANIQKNPALLLSGERAVLAIAMKIGTTIRGYRLQKGLSQGDIEKRTGLLRCYLSRVENGHTVPSLDTLAKIAGALELPLAQLFAEDNLGRQLQSQKLSDDELRFLTQIRRYSTNLNDSDRKLLLAMVKKFATTAVR
ncbi:MAG: helix-turn-helix transcriptional regulator [Acidobacteriaceae bacterium]